MVIDYPNDREKTHYVVVVWDKLDFFLHDNIHLETKLLFKCR